MNQKFRLKASIKLFKKDDIIKITFMNKFQDLRIRCNEVVMFIFHLLTSEHSIEEIVLQTNAKYPKAKRSDIKSVFWKLYNIGVIEEVKTHKYDNSIINRQLNFYSDLVMEPIKMQNQLSNQKVLLLGLGGVGSWIAYLLAQSGINQFDLVDPDVIEVSNLGRQALYFMKDIGKYKVDVISERLHLLSSSIKVRKYRLKITCMEDFNKIESIPDIVINCLDEPSSYLTGKFVTNYYLKLGIPMINGVGYRGNIIRLGLTTIPGKTICWNCANSTYQKEIEGFKPFLDKETRSQAGVTGPLAAYIAAIHAQEAINVLSDELNPILIDKKWMIDFSTLKMKEHIISNSYKKCEICKRGVDHD